MQVEVQVHYFRTALTRIISNNYNYLVFLGPTCKTLKQIVNTELFKAKQDDNLEIKFNKMGPSDLFD